LIDDDNVYNLQAKYGQNLQCKLII
jgi:hypothetical protein